MSLVDRLVNAPPEFFLGCWATIVMLLFTLMHYRRMKRDDARIAKRLEELKCKRGDHDWRTIHEAHSMVSPIMEMDNMPIRCMRCKATATATWKPGEGLSQIVLD